MTASLIELNDIVFMYGEEPVLQDISLTVHKGEYDGLIGPNGGGKTTLLRIILGLLKPASGEVKLFGQPLSEFKDWSKIGYLPQRMTQTDIRFPITVEEVVSQGRIAKAGLFHRHSDEDVAAVDRALKIGDVAHLKERVIADLSGGERQRVFIARALAGEPEILILDEPATGIDVAAQSRFYTFLKELNVKYGITILFVSHDIDILVHEASRLICLNNRLVCDGAAHLIFKENKHVLEALYGDSLHYRFKE